MVPRRTDGGRPPRGSLLTPTKSLEDWAHTCGLSLPITLAGRDEWKVIKKAVPTTECVKSAYVRRAGTSHRDECDTRFAFLSGWAVGTKVRRSLPEELLLERRTQPVIDGQVEFLDAGHLASGDLHPHVGQGSERITGVTREGKHTHARRPCRDSA